MVDPEDVAAALLTELPDGAYLTAAVMAVTYVVPGEDGEAHGPILAWLGDDVAGRWVHLGMAETIALDCREAMRREGA